MHQREGSVKLEASENGKWSGPSHASDQYGNFSEMSPSSPDYDDANEEQNPDLDRR